MSPLQPAARSPEQLNPAARYRYLKIWMMNFTTCGGDFSIHSSPCWQNYMVGYIPWEDTFPSGVRFPPAWPGCDCWVQVMKIEVNDPELPLKSWVTKHDASVCQVCISNENAGWLKKDTPFPSGHQQPPAHDHCRCHLETSTRPRAVDPEDEPEVSPEQPPTPEPNPRRSRPISLS